MVLDCGHVYTQMSDGTVINKTRDENFEQFKKMLNNASVNTAEMGDIFSMLSTPKNGEDVNE